MEKRDILRGNGCTGGTSRTGDSNSLGSLGLDTGETEPDVLADTGCDERLMLVGAGDLATDTDSSVDCDCAGGLEAATEEDGAWTGPDTAGVGGVTITDV